jgi:hypothetical protein
MSHMVIYRSVEGQPVFHQVESLEDAARHVETLRNAGQGGDARIFSMKEVKIEVKTYYRVEVASEETKPAPAPAPAAPVAPVASAPAPAPAPAPAAPAPAPAEAPAPPAPGSGPSPAAVKPEPAVAGAAANGGRFGLFGKS